MKRTLVLRRETLTELTPGDLMSIGGGQIPPPTPVGPTQLIDELTTIFPASFGLPVCLSGRPCL
jgi:hypothetical protein